MLDLVNFFFFFLLRHQEFGLGGSVMQIKVFFLLRRLWTQGVSVFLSYFIRTIKGISAHVMGS